MKRVTIAVIIIVMVFINKIVGQQANTKAIQWRVFAEIPTANGQGKALGLAGPVTGIHQNVLMVAGGANFPDSMPWLGGKKKYYDELYVFKIGNKNAGHHPEIFKLIAPVAYAANCSTPYGVVYAGGENNHGISNKAVMLQWDPIGNKIVAKALPDLPVGVTNAAATVYENTVYIAGGETAQEASDHFYSLDLKHISKGWQPLPSIPKAVSHTVLVVQSNGHHASIYLLGGRRKRTNDISELYAFVYEFDLKNKVWKEKKSLPYNLCAGTGIATGANGIVLFGGDKGETFHTVETLIAAINAEKDESKKQLLNEQKMKLQASHPGFSKEILLYNTLKDEWTEMGTIPFDTPVTTTAVQSGKDVLIPSGEIKAGVRTPRILAAKLNFKSK